MFIKTYTVWAAPVGEMLLLSGTITCKVTGSRQYSYDLEQVACIFRAN